ncbi:superoxide dismutase [Candidatus Gottesmanbacteria bacterium]|nr:superoxide dismutase [Candidatus Gottesmanbacteria bacterium]
MIYQLPKLNYSYQALEPYIDAKTMEIHLIRHHQAYINNLNTVLDKYPQYKDKKVEDLLSDFENIKMDDKDKTFFKNNAGGTINHNLYWEIMGPKKEIDESLSSEIKQEFGSVSEFKKLFAEIAVKHFGSGWAHLVRNQAGKLEVYSLPNQNSPYLNGHTPIIALDVWEHAYYLKYQNRRAEYIEAWWNVLKLL